MQMVIRSNELTMALFMVSVLVIVINVRQGRLLSAGCHSGQFLSMQYQMLSRDLPMSLLPEVLLKYLLRYRSSEASLGYDPDRDTLPPQYQNGLVMFLGKMCQVHKD